MLDLDRDARPTAAKLVEMTTKPDSHDSLPTTLCGICGLGKEDSYSHRNSRESIRSGLEPYSSSE